MKNSTLKKNRKRKKKNLSAKTREICIRTLNERAYMLGVKQACIQIQEIWQIYFDERLKRRIQKEALKAWRR